MIPQRLVILIAAAALGSLTVIRAGEPPPQEEQSERFPELAGAIPVFGSTLDEGRLPAPYFHYTTSVSGVRQRLSVYQNGLVVFVTEAAEGKTVKKVLFPAEAVDQYRNVLSASRLSRIRQPHLRTATSPGRETIRIYDSGGQSVERVFDPALFADPDLEQIRVFLLDLMRVISEDTEITNPMAEYEPRVGDHLIGEDYQRWKVVRLISDTGFAELQCDSAPIREFIPVRDLATRFIGYSREADSTSR